MIITELRDALNNAIADQQTIAALQASLKECSQLLRAVVIENGGSISSERWDSIDWDKFAPWSKSCHEDGVCVWIEQVKE